MKEQNKRQKIKRKLLSKYKLVILNEATFEERFALKLSRLNVIVVFSTLAILLILITFLFIAFTPIKEYIPGYNSSAFKKKAVMLSLKTDSLERVLKLNDGYYNSIKKVLQGEVNTVSFDKDSIISELKKEIDVDTLNPIEEDSLLRAKVDKEDKYNLFETAKTKSDFVLFPPVRGTISHLYNIEEKHYAIDIAVAKNTPIKAILEGTVIFSEWSAETGFVIIIEHSYGLLSIYKHNNAVVKKQGDLVKTGEVIAIAGNTGELTTGPHLHFELWSDGYSINPTNFIDFE